MKDEIKEILDKLKSDNYPFGIAKIDINKLEDYITNLQEENEKLDKELTHKTKQYEFIRHRDNIPYYENIINKAIEKIKKIQENAIKYGADHDAIICQDLLNILKGSNQ